MKLAALPALLKMLRRVDTALTAQHQLVELATNCLTFCFLHNSHLQISPHFLSQEPSGPADSRFHRPLARLQDLRDLVVAATVDVTQDQRGAILLGQRTDRALNGIA